MDRLYVEFKSASGMCSYLIAYIVMKNNKQPLKITARYIRIDYGIKSTLY